MFVDRRTSNVERRSSIVERRSSSGRDPPAPLLHPSPQHPPAVLRAHPLQEPVPPLPHQIARLEGPLRMTVHRCWGRNTAAGVDDGVHSRKSLRSSFFVAVRPPRASDRPHPPRTASQTIYTLPSLERRRLRQPERGRGREEEERLRETASESQLGRRLRRRRRRRRHPSGQPQTRPRLTPGGPDQLLEKGRGEGHLCNCECWGVWSHRSELYPDRGIGTRN